jgi:hypothetical protein
MRSGQSGMRTWRFFRCGIVLGDITAPSFALALRGARDNELCNPDDRGVSVIMLESLPFFQPLLSGNDQRKGS